MACMEGVTGEVVTIRDQANIMLKCDVIFVR